MSTERYVYTVVENQIIQVRVWPHLGCGFGDCRSRNLGSDHLCRRHFPSGPLGTRTYLRFSWCQSIGEFLDLTEDEIRDHRGIGNKAAQLALDVQEWLDGGDVDAK